MTTTTTIEELLSSKMEASAAVGGPSARHPERISIEGAHVKLAPIAARHAQDLYAATHAVEREALWRYMADGPFSSEEAFRASLERKAASEDPQYFAILDAHSGKARGYAAYLRIDPAQRSIEVGSVLYAPELQRTAAATEAMYLMARHAFEDLGYRRYEWKCHSLNRPSIRAALRLGFRFEGVFRQHMIVKGKNRDTAWFAMLDSEWPARKAAFEQWLAPENFDAEGRQRMPLRR